MTDCIGCEKEIDGEPVYADSGFKQDGLEKLADGKEVSGDELFEMDDGPYCSLDCSIADDGDTG